MFNIPHTYFVNLFLKFRATLLIGPTEICPLSLVRLSIQRLLLVSDKSSKSFMHDINDISKGFKSLDWPLLFASIVKQY